MEEFKKVAKYILLSSFVGFVICANNGNVISSTSANFLNILDDVIPDVENTTQKVIRINPIDLPQIVEDKKNNSDSSLYKIQSQHTTPIYLSSSKFRKSAVVNKNIGDSQILRSVPGKKLSKSKTRHLTWLHYFQDNGGKQIGKKTAVRLAPGGYPIYYVLAKSNAKFNKHPIKGFRNQQELEKYSHKIKRVN